jgi:O-acetyl-ADP-ribose deacetylase (regulator of RNase III)
MPFSIVRNDITKIKADVIVNTANPHPVIGGGTDSAIYEAAGRKKLLEKRREIGDIAPGDVAYTPAFGLNAKFIFHTVGPKWIDGNHHERETLHSCYRKSLELAASLNIKSIAFPLISTGVYGFPKDEALSIATEEIHTFLLAHESVKVLLVVFDRKSFVLSAERFGGLEAYIDEHYVGSQSRREYSARAGRFEDELCEEALYRMSYAETETFEEPKKLDAASLDEMLDFEDMTFQQKLLSLIDEKGLKDSEFYRAAGITKQVFSVIRSNEDYQPKKETAIGAVLALELDMEKAEI